MNLAHLQSQTTHLPVINVHAKFEENRSKTTQVLKHQKWGLYFHFFRACVNFVSKRFETTETFGLSQFSSCFSPFQFFPYIIHCFSVSKHQKWGLVFSLFPELVSILFRNVSKQLKHLDLVYFVPVSVRFSFFPI